MHYLHIVETTNWMETSKLCKNATWYQSQRCCIPVSYCITLNRAQINFLTLLNNKWKIILDCVSGGWVSTRRIMGRSECLSTGIEKREGEHFVFVFVRNVQYIRRVCRSQVWIFVKVTKIIKIVVRWMTVIGAIACQGHILSLDKVLIQRCMKIRTFRLKQCR